MRKILINMSNIHSGGALQVAISFISEMIKLSPKNLNVEVLISTKIASAFKYAEIENSEWNIKIYNTYGLKTLFSSLNRIQKKYDIVFTLFGPKYTWFKAKKDIVGFAQPWISSTDNSFADQMPWHKYILTSAKYSLQKYFFKRADLLVVELDHVKDSLIAKGICNAANIHVVPNCIANHYFDQNKWKSCKITKIENEVSIGYITRDYPHKNIKVLYKVADLLNNKYKLSMKFYFTLRDDEWSRHKDKFGPYAVNLGEITVFECPNFYNEMDGIIFPSLLECFSAAPLESLFMEKPLFASDRAFVKDVCAEHAMYFNPLDPYAIAKVVSEYYLGKQKLDAELHAAKRHVVNFSNASSRAREYINILSQRL